MALGAEGMALRAGCELRGTGCGVRDKPGRWEVEKLRNCGSQL